MTSDEPRRRRMLDAQDDKVILPDAQAAAMVDELLRLYDRRTALDSEIAQIHAVLHESDEARRRKASRGPVPVRYVEKPVDRSYEDRLRDKGFL